MEKIKIVGFLIITIAINFISCVTNKYYEFAYGYWQNDLYYPFPQRPEYFDWIVVELNLNKNGLYPFFSLKIQGNLNKNTQGIKTITVDELKIVTKNTTYDMRGNIYGIYFMETISDKKNIQKITDFENFYNTGIIDIPIEDEWFSGCVFYGKNPGIMPVSNLTVLLNIKIEMEDGAIEQIVRKFNGRKRTDIYNIFQIMP